MTAISPAAPILPWPQRLLSAPWLDGPALSFFLEEMNPLWSLVETRARVLAVIDETHDTRSFMLKPGWGWRRFEPGQHIGVAVEIDGRLLRRRYSISSAPASRRRDAIMITVKREPGGKVSNWLHDHLRAGDVLRLDTPAGDFVLPAARPDRLLMLAAGSGITPIMGQLRALLSEGYAGEITLLHYVRSGADRIFADALTELAAQHPGLKVHWCTEDGAIPERFSAEQLSAHVPDYARRHTMLCGPAGFMRAVREHWDAAGLNERLQFEYFGSVPELKPLPRAAGIKARAALSGRRREIDLAEDQPLLQALEAAGETPAYGCRQGICQSCKCRKTAGTVRNLLTGEISREPEQDIQLCVSIAETDIILAY